MLIMGNDFFYKRVIICTAEKFLDMNDMSFLAHFFGRSSAKAAHAEKICAGCLTMVARLQSMARVK